MGVLRYAIDIAYVIIAVVIIVRFAKRGFFESLFRFGRHILAGFLSYYYGPRLGTFIHDKWIFKWIAEPIEEKITNFLMNTVGSLDIDSMLDSLPLAIRSFADAETLKTQYGETVSNLDVTANELAESVSGPFAGLLSNMIAYIVVYFSALLLLTLIIKLINSVFKLPVLSAVNGFLGFLLGVLAAFLLLAFATWAIGLVFGLFGGDAKLAELTESTIVFGYFRELNFFKLFQ